jgi:hypothetical protein
VLLRITPVHGAGNKLQGMIKGCRRHMFVFLANRAVPPTKNGSQQVLRPCVIFRKVTSCFRSDGPHTSTRTSDQSSKPSVETSKILRALEQFAWIGLARNSCPAPIGVSNHFFSSRQRCHYTVQII